MVKEGLNRSEYQCYEQGRGTYFNYYCLFACIMRNIHYIIRWGELYILARGVAESVRIARKNIIYV